MRKYFILFIFVISGLSLAAQVKTFSISELVNNQLPADFKQNLPVFVKWMSDEQVMLKLSIAPEKEPSNYVLDIASGKYTPATPEQLKGTLPPFRSAFVKEGKLFYKEGTQQKQITQKTLHFVSITNSRIIILVLHIYKFNFLIGSVLMFLLLITI
jgi:hypothetical protein